MGRPLHKKYFGNRNIGTSGLQTGANANNQNYADDRIGGEGVEIYSPVTAGSGWTSQPTVTFSAPNIPGGVTVAGTPHFSALSFATTSNGTGYNLGDTLEVDTGTASTKARAPVNALTVVGITLKNGGTANDVGDIFAFNNPKFAIAMRVRVTASLSGVATAVEIVDGGSLVTGPLPGATDEGGFTRVQTFGTTDTNGQALEVNFTAWGVYSFGAVSTLGDYTVFPSTGAAGTLTSVTGGGSGAKADITLGVQSIVVTQRGSGYTSPADAAVSFSGSTGAAAVAILTTDSGLVGSATNQENAILMTAFLVGGSATTVDIIRQVSTNRYKVTDGTRTGIAKLKSSVATAAGEGSVRLVDTDGGTYFATKITARKVVITRGTGTQAAFVTGSAVKWNMTAATADSLLIDNA